jgi:D-alanyl-D-alanine dipeptidase
MSTQSAIISACRDYILSDDFATRRQSLKTVEALLGPAQVTPVPLDPSFEELFSRPVADSRSVSGWKEISTGASDELLVPIGPFARLGGGPDLRVAVNAIYFQEDDSTPNFLGQAVDRRVSLITHFLRQSAAASLVSVAERLESAGIFLIVYDCFRPLAVQAALFEAFREHLVASGAARNEDLEAEVQKFVSLPSPDHMRGATHVSPHATGGVVDLSLGRLSRTGRELLRFIDENRDAAEWSLPSDVAQRILDSVKSEAREKLSDPSSLELFRDSWLPIILKEYSVLMAFREFGSELDMGTEFDSFSEEAATAAFEKRPASPAAANRRLLFHCMRQAGFENYEAEWWHYMLGDGMWARKTGRPATRYGLAEFTSREKDFEFFRRAIWQVLPAVPVKGSHK